MSVTRPRVPPALQSFCLSGAGSSRSRSLFTRQPNVTLLRVLLNVFLFSSSFCCRRGGLVQPGARRCAAAPGLTRRILQVGPGPGQVCVLLNLTCVNVAPPSRAAVGRTSGWPERLRRHRYVGPLRFVSVSVATHVCCSSGRNSLSTKH